MANAKLRARLDLLASLADPVAVAEISDEIARRMTLPTKPSMDAVVKADNVEVGYQGLAPLAADAAVALERRVWRGDPFNGSWNRADCTLTTIDGKPALRIAVRAGDKDLGAAETDVRVARRPRLVRLRVRNESPHPFPIMIGLRTGDLYHECRPIDLAADGAFHDVEVDLARSDFKCAASAWQHSAKLVEPEYLNLITVVLLCGKAGGAVTVQGVTVVEEKP